jgi:hypothetical protein
MVCFNKQFLRLMMAGFVLAMGQVQALTVDEQGNILDGESLSKDDIARISQQFADKKVNGRKFSIHDVEKRFDHINNGNYKKYHEAVDNFKRDYGHGILADLLFQLANGQHHIKKIERRFKTKISNEQQVKIADGAFIGSASPLGRGSSLIDSDFQASCVLSKKTGDTETECSHDSGSTGILGISIFIFTNGNLGSTNGARREKTICTNSQMIDTLVLNHDKNGREIIEYTAYEGRGSSVVYDRNVWFRGEMKDRAKSAASERVAIANEKLQNFSCETHRPWNNPQTARGTQVQPQRQTAVDVVEDIVDQQDDSGAPQVVDSARTAEINAAPELAPLQLNNGSSR